MDAALEDHFWDAAQHILDHQIRCANRIAYLGDVSLDANIRPEILESRRYTRRVDGRRG